MLHTILTNSKGKYPLLNILILFHGARVPSGPKPPHCRSYTITLRHTIFRQDSSRRVISPTHNTLKRQSCLRQDSNSQSQQANGRQNPRLRPRGHWDLQIIH